jgi:hypothetical protein
VASARHTIIAVIALAALGVGAASFARRGDVSLRERAEPAAPLDPRSARENALLRQNADARSDAALAAKYDSRNATYFNGSLPRVRIVWEAGMNDGGGESRLVLKGLTDGRVILLNPMLQNDPKELDRVLCHEMVHVSLFAGRNPAAGHGPEFQAALRRLSDAGAFEAIAASDQVKAAFKQALDRDAARIDAERQWLDATNDDIKREDEAVKSAFDALNKRIAKANREEHGWPSKQEQMSVEHRQDRLKQRVDDYNVRVKQFNDDVAAFNKRTGVYNLMTAYPDGLDESAVVKTKTARQP